MADTDIKKELYVLIDKLPESSITAVKLFLEFLVEKAEQLERDAQFLALAKAFDEAPECDEELTEEDLRDLQEAREAIKAGRTTSWKQVQEELS
jgi:hypothetical protein